ncbi:MAG TPA: peptide MFS transporter [Steroidobacteraceae bacterium]|nr:peptide MFS transporter [Steroidobacteraceae bacterium]
MSAAIESPAPAPAARPRPEFLGHPRGLAYIALTEAWERFSFYGMQALLMLYMTGHLLEPGTLERVVGLSSLRAGLESVLGTLSIQELASTLFGLYVALVYFTPVAGGLVGDRLTGRRRAVLLGAVLMSIGHFLLAFDATFLPGLAALIVGSGLLKGNLAAQVGNLYARDDSRRDGAYTVYVTAINVGAFVAPLVCGTLGELYSWHYGFGAAGIGMLLGIAIYLSGSRYLPPEQIMGQRQKAPPLQPGDGRALVAIFVVLAITSLFWTAQAQVWNVYPLWLRDHVDRSAFGGTVPVTWFQSLDSLTVLLLAPLVVIYWQSQAKRAAEPGDLSKIALGCGFFVVAYVLLTAGQLTAHDGQAGLGWAVAFHFFTALSYLYAAPVALALVTRAAPPSVNGMIAGAYYLGLFVGGILSGRLARFYEPLGPAAFWGMHALVAGSGTALLLLLRRPLLRALRLTHVKVERRHNVL